MIEVLKNVAYGDCDPKESLVVFLSEALKESGYAIETDGCNACKKSNVKRVFFDFTSGAFFCEECFNGTGREISPTTFNAFIKIGKNQSLSLDESVKALRLLDFYLENKTDVRLNSLKELIKISTL